MLSDSFIKTAQQLHDTEQRDVVKVASLVRKLQNLWRTLTSSEHRANVEMLEAETAKTMLGAKNLSQDLQNLSKSISNGNLEEYTAALKVVKERIKMLEQDIENIRVDTNSEFNETARKLPEDYDLNLDTEYDTPLKDFSWLRDRPPTMFFGKDGKPAEILVSKVVRALRKNYPDVDIRKRFFSGDNTQRFMQGFVEAAFDGKIQGRIQNTPNGRVFTIKTAPFVMPGERISLSATVRLLDNTTSLQGQLSLRGTDKVEVVTLADLAEQVKEPEPEAVSEPPARGVPEEDIPVIEEIPATQPSTEIEPILPEESTVEEQTTASRYDILVKLAQLQQQQQLPYQITNLSDVEFAEALREGYKTVFGKDPTAETLAGAWAQATLESGRPVKLPNNNVGNIKATTSWIDSGKPYFVKDTSEFTESGKKYIHSQAKWRAYPTPAAGAAGYWQLIGNRYDQAMKWMAAGDPESASVALGVKGYYTASPKKYATAVGKIYKYFMDTVAPQLPGLESAPAETPGPKPVLKNWVADYTKEERDSILKPAAGQTAIIEADGPFLEDVSDLINKLVASENPVTSFVKKSLIKEIPKSSVLVKVRSNASKIEEIEFANIVASLCRRQLRINANVCAGDVVEISCNGRFNQAVLAGAVQELCDLVADSMQQKTGSFVSPIAIGGHTSKNTSLSVDDIIENRRKFDMKRLSHG
jgi:hypothetical protein